MLIAITISIAPMFEFFFFFPIFFKQKTMPPDIQLPGWINTYLLSIYGIYALLHKRLTYKYLHPFDKVVFLNTPST